MWRGAYILVFLVLVEDDGPDVGVLFEGLVVVTRAGLDASGIRLVLATRIGAQVIVGAARLFELVGDDGLGHVIPVIGGDVHVALADEFLHITLVSIDPTAGHAAHAWSGVDDEDKLDGLTFLVSRARDAQKGVRDLRIIHVVCGLVGSTLSDLLADNFGLALIGEDAPGGRSGIAPHVGYGFFECRIREVEARGVHLSMLPKAARTGVERVCGLAEFGPGSGALASFTARMFRWAAAPNGAPPEKHELMVAASPKPNQPWCRAALGFQIFLNGFCRNQPCGVYLEVWGRQIRTPAGN